MTTKIDKDDALGWSREARAKKRYLKELSEAVTAFLVALDVEMGKPSSEGRGKRIAALSNGLDMANDEVRYFALGVNWRKDKKETK